MSNETTISVRRIPGLDQRFSISEELQDGRKVEVIVHAKHLDQLIGDLLDQRESLNPKPML